MPDSDSNIPIRQTKTCLCQHMQLSWHKSEADTARGIITVTWHFKCPDCGVGWSETAEYMSDDYYQGENYASSNLWGRVV